MTKVAFLLSKDPVTAHGGDAELGRVVMRLAANDFDVSAIALSDQDASLTSDVVPGGLALTRVLKPPIRKAPLLIDAVRTRRSLVHVRFDIDGVVAAIDASDADVFVSDHSYMAENFLRSRQHGRRGFVINTGISESHVWSATRGVLGTVESPRLLRDEMRVARAADAIGCYEIEEAQMYRDNGVAGARFLDVTLPPKDRVDVSASGRRLVFMGARSWPPNQEAFLYALRLWPRISEGIPDAELCVIGAKKPGAADPTYPPGVRDLGFVEDLHEFLGTCRALMAPIKTGGGVRVKILDAASIGLPVIGTGPAVGSLQSVFGMAALDSEAEFVEECRRLLLDRAAAVAAGEQLYDVNSEHWRAGRPRHAIERLLLAGVRP
jgi:glycosyltransferase involved in cell wall biosynthesis